MGLAQKPWFYIDVVVFGAACSEDEARIDGEFQLPDYGLSYLLAARHVVEAGQRDSQLNEVALPAAYLQRHAFELLLKQLLNTARSLKSYQIWEKLLESDPHALEPAAPSIEDTHILPALCASIETALADVGFAPLPDPIKDMCKRLTNAEDGSPERFRYHSVHDKSQPSSAASKRRKVFRPSFTSEEVLKVVETQARLEELAERFFVLSMEPTNEEDWSLRTKIAKEAEYIFQAIEG